MVHAITLNRKHCKIGYQVSLNTPSFTFVCSLCICTEAATRGVLQKQVFLEISQNSQENTCTRASFFSCSILTCGEQFSLNILTFPVQIRASVFFLALCCLCLCSRGCFLVYHYLMKRCKICLRFSLLQVLTIWNS